MWKTLALAATLLLAGCTEAPPWNSDSRSLSLRSFGYWSGSSGYDRDRSRLTVEQLALLDRLEVIDPHSSCAEDILDHTLTIVDAAGVARRYHANSTNEACDSELPLVSIESLRPFLQTFRCISAGDTRSRTGQPVPAWALVVHPGDGCLHGVFLDGGRTTVRFEVPVTTPAPLTIETIGHSSVAGQVTLIDLDGATVLGVGSEPAGRPDCSSLTYDFTVAGTYYVEVTSINSAISDILLRIE